MTGVQTYALPIFQASEGPVLARVAVNVPPGESDVRNSTSLKAAQLASMPDQLQRKIPLSPWLMGLGMSALLGAAIWGGRREPS